MACVVDLDAENKLLKCQIQAFKLELEDKESQLTMSANLGNELLESNNQLNRYLEEIQESHLQELEVCCQKFRLDLVFRHVIKNQLLNMVELV